MSGVRDGAAVRLPPPLVFLGGILLGALIQALLLRLELPVAPPVRAAITVAATTVGFLVMGAALGLFRDTAQDPKPWEPTPEVITGGIYRFTRNPMYVGMALLQTAFGFGLGNPWILFLLPVTLLTVHYTAVRHEEAYLESKFGTTYTDYRSKVRRYL